MRDKRNTFWLLAAFLSIGFFARGGTPEEFAGTWEARLKGVVICTLELKAGETITGSMHACKINVNSEGDLIETEPADPSAEAEAILHAKLEGETLSFETRDPDDEKPVRFELHLTGHSQADLTIVDAPVHVKPIHFKRQ